jgi:hypothetical protein
VTQNSPRGTARHQHQPLQCGRYSEGFIQSGAHIFIHKLGDDLLSQRQRLGERTNLVSGISEIDVFFVSINDFACIVVAVCVHKKEIVAVDKNVLGQLVQLAVQLRLS